ncbi:TPA: transketolase C-terminal domain-containing protein [Streptococcus pneumoniae]
METKTMSFRDTIILAMSEEMRRDENVFLMGEDVGVFGGDFGTSVGMLEELAEEGISVEIVDPRTLVPLDKDIIINSVKKTGKVVLVNDAHKTSGYIGEISAIISESEAFDYLDAPIRRCAGEDVPMPYAQNLENAMIPTVESIKDAIRKTYNKE